MAATPSNFVKIDGALVQALTGSPELQQRVRVLVEQAKARKGIETIAERVEDANTMAVLWQLGVQYIQGYLVHAPEEIVLARALGRAGSSRGATSKANSRAECCANSSGMSPNIIWQRKKFPPAALVCSRTYSATRCGVPAMRHAGGLQRIPLKRHGDRAAPHRAAPTAPTSDARQRGKGRARRLPGLPHRSRRPRHGGRRP